MYIFISNNIWRGSLYFHSWKYLVRGWLYHDIIFSLLAIFNEGVNISWHIFTPDNIGERVIILYIMFSLLTIFGERVIILWLYIFTPSNIKWGGEYIVTLYFHPWQYWWGGEYIVTLYFHSLQYLVRGWIYHDILFSPLIILVRGWLYHNIMFSLLTIFGEVVIILWHYIIIPDTTLESGTGGDYIWIFSLSKFDSAVIPGFIIHIHIFTPWDLGLKWLYLSRIPLCC